jgi:hypothetical protein
MQVVEIVGGCDLLIREIRRPGPLRVLDRNRADIAGGVEVEHRVLVQIGVSPARARSSSSVGVGLSHR